MCAHVTLTFIKVTFCDIVEPDGENGMSKIIMDFGSEWNGTAIATRKHFSFT